MCGSPYSSAHHLRFSEPRAMGKKVSDANTVPLCHDHHMELHAYGKGEKAWWASQGVDPIEWMSEFLANLSEGLKEYG